MELRAFSGVPLLPFVRPRREVDALPVPPW
jgi:hypothetical protein